MKFALTLAAWALVLGAALALLPREHSPVLMQIFINPLSLSVGGAALIFALARWVRR